MADHLVPPYGGALLDVVVDDERASELRKASIDWPSWDLTPRHLCDLELLLSGAFSPLRGFLGSADVASVCADMRLSDGTLWPIPVTLDVPDGLAAQGSVRVRRSPCATPRG
jgi:sulfate adenylyltransferase